MQLLKIVLITLILLNNCYAYLPNQQTIKETQEKSKVKSDEIHGVATAKIALDYTHSTSLANTNNHTEPKSLEAYLQLQQNNDEFGGLDKDSGDNMPLVIIPIVVGLIGAEQSLNAPEDDRKLTTPFENASKIGRDYVRETVDSPKEIATGFDNAGAVAELLGAAVMNEKTPKSKVTGTALIATGLVIGGLKEFLNPSSPEVNARNLQIDYFTQPLPNIIEAPTQLILKKINEEVNKDEK